MTRHLVNLVKVLPAFLSVCSGLACLWSLYAAISYFASNTWHWSGVR